ncbi:MAG: hypothetical protein R3C26_23675 [Calditrichia bacterium]
MDTTASEINNLGFEVYRSTSDTGPFELVATFATDPCRPVPETAMFTTPRFQRSAIGQTILPILQAADVDYNGVRKFHSVISATTADDQNLISGFELGTKFPNPF